MSVFRIIFLIFIASQLYWAWRGYTFIAARMRSRGRRLAVCAAVLLFYLVAFQFNFGIWSRRATPVHLTPGEALLTAPFLWWASSSLVAFFLAMLFVLVRGIAGGMNRLLAP